MQSTRFLSISLTVFALVAFAANSVLCRMALGQGSIDAASFSALRLLAGAGMLLLISRLKGSTSVDRVPRRWIPAFMLFIYAVCFSFAYLSLSTGTGALILFGAVQATMIVVGVFSGERPHVLQWFGLCLALGGLVYLVMPGLSAPSLSGSLLMLMAGVGWGVYSLLGRGSTAPLRDTTDNFVRALPFVLLVGLFWLRGVHISTQGLALAVASGALASGVGYVVWYAALRYLSATRAATVQLSVPVLAALGGVVLLSEQLSFRLVLSALFILGGVFVVVVTRERAVAANQPFPVTAAPESPSAD